MRKFSNLRKPIKTEKILKREKTYQKREISQT